MSKTIRRKNKNWNFNNYDYVYKDGYVQIIKYDYESKEFKLLKNKYHSDNYFTYSAPHWFANLFSERKLRRETNKKIKISINNLEKEVVFPIFIKDAKWKYW